MSARGKLYRQQARLLREERRRLRRKEDERDLKKLPWWRQRTMGNLILAIIRDLERR